MESPYVCGIVGAGVAIMSLWLVGCRETKVLAEYPDEYFGVGVELEIEGDYPVVRRAFPDGPAGGIGVKAGDKITAIDGESVKGSALASVVARLRGRSGSAVTVTIARPGEPRTLLFSIRRGGMKRSAAGGKGTDYSRQ